MPPASLNSRHNRRRCWAVALALLGCLWTFAEPAAAPVQPTTGTSRVPEKSTQASTATRRVFILCSFNSGYTWTDNMLHGIREEFALSGLTIDPYVRFMDMKRIPRSAEYFSEFRDLLRTGYRNTTFDAVMACDNDALDFLRQYRDDLFPGVPLVFVSINDYSVSLLNGRQDLTGTSENTDYLGTIEAALKLRPQTKTVVVLTDATTTGQAHRSAVEKLAPQLANRVAFRHLSFSDYTMEEMGAELATLKSDNVVLLLQHFRDKNGASHTVDQSTPFLTARCAVPCFVVTDIRLGIGALGGDLVSGYYHGQAAAKMAVDILNGTPVSRIPVLLESPNKFMFDYHAMQRFGIPKRVLPATSVIINQPPSMLVQYRMEVTVAVVVFATACLFLVLMAMEILRRKRVEEALQESRRQYRNLVEETPDLITRVDIDGRLVFINHAALDVYGVAPEAAIGHLAFDFVHPDDRAATEAAFRGWLQHGTTAMLYENRQLGSNGQVHHMTWSIRAEHDDTGRITGFASTARDITDRKQAEDALLLAHERLRRFVDANVIGILIATPAGTVIEANDYYLRLIGYTREELAQGKVDWRAITPPEWLPADEQAIRQLHERGTCTPYEKEYVRRDGSRIPILLADTLLPGPNEQIAAFALDLTAHKQAEEKLRQRDHDLQQRNDELMRFNYTVSHDLKSPLVTISTFLGYLEKDLLKPDAAQVAKDIGFIRNAADKMTRLLEELLVLSRIGRQQNPPVQVPLQMVVQDALALVAGQIATRGVTVDVTTTPHLLRGDRVRLTEIFQNLLDNACKFMGDQAAPRIEIGLESKDGAPVISVRDNGIGIDPRHHAKLFGLFEKLDPGTAGTGIGLALVKRIVEVHGGRIWAESAGLGHGTTFRFTLPDTAGSQEPCRPPEPTVS